MPSFSEINDFSLGVPLRGRATKILTDNNVPFPAAAPGRAFRTNFAARPAHTTVEPQNFASLRFPPTNPTLRLVNVLQSLTRG